MSLLTNCVLMGLQDLLFAAVRLFGENMETLAAIYIVVSAIRIITGV